MHGQAPHLHNEFCKGLSALCCESREKGANQGRGRSGHLLADGLWRDGAESSTGKTDRLRNLFAKAPKINPSRSLIKGVVCGVRVEDIKEPTMQEIRYLDKLV